MGDLGGDQQSISQLLLAQPGGTAGLCQMQKGWQQEKQKGRWSQKFALGKKLFHLGRDLEGKAEQSSLQVSSHPNPQRSSGPLKAQAQRREHRCQGRGGQKVSKKVMWAAFPGLLLHRHVTATTRGRVL